MSDPYDLLLSDPDLSAALSEVGIFIFNFQTGKSIASATWIEEEFGDSLFRSDANWIKSVHPQDQKRVAGSVDRIYRGEQRVFQELFRLMKADGTVRWVLSKGRAVGKGPENTPILFIGSDSDVTAYKDVQVRMEQNLAELETLREVAAVIGSSLDFSDTVSRVLEQTRRIIPYQTATVQLLDDDGLRVIGGFGFANLEKVKSFRFPYPDEGSLSTRAIQELRPIMSGNVALDFPGFVQPDDTNPIVSWLGIPLFRRGQVIGLVTADSTSPRAYTSRHLQLAATIGDHISIALENARLHDETYTMVMTDALTGVGSRHRLSIEGRLIYEAAFRKGHSLGVLMIDLDHFKKVNDTYGHDIGDRVLRRVCATWSESLRSTDLLARYGGEEFVILLPETSFAAAQTLAERLRQRTEALAIEDLPLPVTISLGVAAQIPPAGRGLESLFHEADLELYKAKQGGRNRISPGI